ncbi:hypothetical protein [Schleiferilactobacillus harbinensis]|uniref:hypothetical protein n=1 Tax=Schleiferilactobacillus harbinensis TaxID=304207 RepID=UPI00345EB529
MKTQIEKENDARMTQLKGMNHLYIEELVGYLRNQPQKDYLALEETIADVIDNAADAQAHGRSARQYFGEDAQAAAKAISETIPAASLSEKLVFFIPLFSMLMSYTIYPAILQPTIQFDWGSLVGSWMFICMAFLPWIVSFDQHRIILFLLLFLSLPLASVGYALVTHQPPSHLAILLSTWPVAAALLVLMPLLFLLMAWLMRPLRIVPLSWCVLSSAASIFGFLLHYCPVFREPILYWGINSILIIAVLALFIWQLNRTALYRQQISQLQPPQ